MNCKYCGAELLGNSSFCVKCGKSNNEEIVEVKNNDELLNSIGTDNKGLSKKKNKLLNLKLFLIPILLIIFFAIVFTISIVIPCTPKASLESGRYEECIRVSFSASKILSFGINPEIYISVDGKGFNLYDGQEYYLNQVDVYSFDVYTVNGAGIKSSDKHFEYDMSVPKPHELNVNVSPGIYEDYQDVEILADDGSTVYFTVDGSEPNENSNVYDSAIHLENGKTTIKAFAINKEGTVGDIYQWEYELELPIPSQVSYSVEGGVFYSAFDLELKSDSDATIYYTVDGSEPTTQSNVYSEPLRLENGIYTIKAMAINSYDMPSETSTSNYAVTLQKYARYPKSAVADKFYGIIGDSGAVVAFDSQMNEVQRYRISGAQSIYSDGKSIYYLASNTLFKLNENDGSSVKVVDMYIDNFALAGDKLYIESSNLLYSMSLDGDNLSKYDDIDSCIIMGCWDAAVYYSNGSRVFKIASSESEPEVITEIEGSKFFVRESKIYYIDEEQGLSCKDLEDGSIRKMINATSEYYNLDPSFELINTTDNSEIITTTCMDLYACDSMLYVLKRIDDEYRTYHLLTKSTDVSSSTSYKWYVINLESEGISDTNIFTSIITVFDNVIFDGNENRNQVIQ